MTEMTASPTGCQEASSMSAQFYIPCNRPATRMIKNRDATPYRMCDMCAHHNVKNRGATDIGPFEGATTEVGANEAVDYSAYEADAQADKVDGADLLARITQTVRELGTARADVAEAEATLKARQERVRQLEEFTLPEMMREAGQQMLRTVDGEIVELTETLHASIPVANLPLALKWLLDHNQGAIIKRNIALAFGKNEEDKADRALAIILEAGYTPQDKQSVHPQTLAATLRELIAEGIDVPMELLGAHVRSYAKVKLPKK